MIVPWRGGCPYREAAWNWLEPRYGSATLAPGPDPWNKALAVMPAIERSSADIVVVVDADVWCPGLADAISAVEDGAPWAQPHRGVYRLSEKGTQDLFRGDEDFEHLDLTQPAYGGTCGGGCVVAPRQTLLDIPLDPRFVGWGGEDESWGCALTSLAGSPVRIKTPLAHLWHPPQERLSRRWGSLESRRLSRRYHQAVHAPDQMRALIQEARGSLDSH